MGFTQLLWARLFRRNRQEAEMSEELGFHIDSRAADLERGGMEPEKALRQARMEFGGVEDYKEQCREARGFRPFDEFGADIRFALRTMRKNAGFTAMGVLSLALGIGVNLSCFASLYAMILHPFAYPELERIMTVWETRANAPAERDAAAPANYIDWKQGTRSFEALAAYRDWDVNLTGVDRPDHIRGAMASAEFFHVLGMEPAQGRTFTADECEPGHDAVVVVSHGFWKTRMASAPDAVGKTLSLGGRRYTVIGVMPDEFNLPLESELWAPLAFTQGERSERALQQLMVIGKLKPGVTKTQAAADMDGIARQLEAQYPLTNEQRRVLLVPLRNLVNDSDKQFLLVLTSAALFVLVLACINVGGLQVARMMSREKEMGLRTALGASYFRLFRQLLTESLLMGLAGGVAGLAFAAWNLNIMRANIPAMVYRIVAGLKDMQVNGPVATFAIVLSLAASILCCVPVAIKVLRGGRNADVNEVLKEGGRSSNASPSRSRIRSALVAMEVALAFVLLVGAGLMVGALQRMVTLNLGYDWKNVLGGEITLSGNQYATPAKITNFYDQLLQNLEQASGVDAAAARGTVASAQSIIVEGRAPSRPGEPAPDLQAATSGYLRAMRMPLLKGRWISAQDGPDKARVVVVSESVARHYWPGGNPLGARIKLGNSSAPWLTVIGVAGDVKDWFLGRPSPTAYVSYRQFPQPSMQVLLRGLQDSRRLTGDLRAVAATIDREQPFYNVHTLEQQIHEETSGVRNAATMMGTYAAIALLLAVTGIYSISSFFVTQRTREIGVRMSLGASRPAILKMVLLQSCKMAGIGLAIGLPVAVLMTLGMSSALYGIVSLHPSTFVLFIVVLGGAALLAAYVPAYRAAKVDPLIALRHE